MALYMKTRSFLNRKMEISYQLREQVFRFITEQKLIEKDDAVITGVSGGADSVCLLFLLLELKDRLPFSLSAVHVEHGIREKASRNDAAFVADLCRKINVPLRIIPVDAIEYAKNNKLTLEEAARTLRYNAFADIIREQENEHVKIAVAHHKEDQAETVLFQMARGSGLRGLGGMQPKRGPIIRPLLSCSHQDLLLYLSEREQPYCVDETNADNKYARNRIRNVILPELKIIQPGCVEHMANAAKELQEVERFIQAQALPVFHEVTEHTESGLRIRTEPLLKQDPVLQKEIIRMAIGECVPEKKDILRRHIESILILSRQEEKKELHLPKGLIVKKEVGVLLFQTGNPEEKEFPEGPWILYREEPKEADPEVEHPIGSAHLLKCRIFPYEKGFSIPEDTYTKWLDYDRIKNGLQIRTRRKGDYLCIDDEGHRKSLQDYFVNNKIPSELRDQILLLSSGDHVVWIPGYRISTAFKITDRTKKVIELQITGGLSWQKK